MERRLRQSLIALALAGAAGLGVLARLAFEQDAGPAPPRLIDVGGAQFQRWASPRALPELRFTDAAGRPMSLRDFRGRVVLLNLWATWCPPCLEEMPALDRLNGKLGGAGFVVVALALDSGPKAEEFLRRIKATTLLPYTDSGGVALRTFGVTNVPTTLLIGRDGREIGRLSGAAAWDQKPALDLIRPYLGDGS